MGRKRRRIRKTDIAKAVEFESFEPEEPYKPKDWQDTDIEEIGIDPADQLRDLLERKYAQAVREEKGRRRTVASLQRLGYRWEDIRRALEEFTPSVGGEDDSETWHIE